MIRSAPKSRGLPFLLSLLIHVVIFALLLTGAGALYHQHQATPALGAAAPQPVVIAAVAVDQAAVDQQIQAIKTDRAQKRAAEAAYQKQLADLAKAAKATAAAETAKWQVAASQLARVQALQAQAAAKLAQLEQTRVALDAQTQQIQTQLSTTQAKLAAETSALKQQQLRAQIQREKTEEQAIEQQQMANETDKYKTLILDKVGKEWIIPPGVDPSLTAKFQVAMDLQGKVLSVVLVQSSGNALLDRSATTAIWKASPLPVPANPWLQKNFQNLLITVKPEGLLMGGN